MGRAACARRLPPPRNHGCGARRGACAHAPPPRRRKAQLRDVSHLDRKSRLVTAAWRCTPRAGAPPPSEKAVAEVERIASIFGERVVMKRRSRPGGRARAEHFSLSGNRAHNRVQSQQLAVSRVELG